MRRICGTINSCRSIRSRSLVCSNKRSNATRSSTRLGVRQALAIAMKKQKEQGGDDDEGAGEKGVGRIGQGERGEK